MIKRNRKAESSSTEPVTAEKPSRESFTTPKKKAKVVEEKDIIDLTMDPGFVDSAEGYDEDWKSSKPASPLQTPKSSNSAKPEKKYPFTPPTGKLLESRSKPESSRGTTVTSSAASSETGESYTYGKKRGRGFVIQEEISSSSEESD